MKTARIIVYDGNSTDGTQKEARAAGAEVFVQKGRGKGAAMREVLESIDSDIYLFVDGDDTYPADGAKKLIAPILRDEADMVVGTRVQREPGAMSMLHVFGNKIITNTINVCFRTGFSDVLSGYRAMNRAVANDVFLVSSGFEVETELTINVLMKKYRILEVPMAYRRRPGDSKSKLGSLADGYLIFFTILSLFRDYRPLLFFGSVAAVLFFAGIALGLVVFIEWLKTGLVARVPSAILSTLLILTSIQLASVGMCMDMIKNKMRDMQYEIKRSSKKSSGPSKAR